MTHDSHGHDCWHIIMIFFWKSYYFLRLNILAMIFFWEN